MDRISGLMSNPPTAKLSPSKQSLGGADYLRLNQTNFRKAAKLLIYIHSPDVPSLDSVALLLAKLHNAFHPSLSSSKSPILGEFIVGLARQLSKRIREDAFAENVKDPISDQDVDGLIDAMLPAVSQGMFSKSGPLAMCSIGCMKHMASVRPAKVLPNLIENAVVALESFESHRTTALLEAIAVTMRNIQLTQPQHIPMLLELSLPGIDANDFGKTFATMRVAFALLSWMPITADNDAMAEWSLSFLSQLFCMFPHMDKAEKKDYAVTGPLMSITCHLFWSQLDQTVFDLALTNLEDYIRNNTDINAKREISYLVSGAARARPEQTLRLLVPSLTRMINADTSSSTKRQLSLYLLGHALRYAGPHILTHRDDVIAVLDDTLTDKDDKQVRVMASKCLRYLLHGLSGEYITTLDSFDQNATVDIESLTAEWHSPNQQQVDATGEIIHHYLDPAIASLNDIMNDSSEAMSNSVRESIANTLALISNICRGAALYLPDWFEDPVFSEQAASRKGFIELGTHSLSLDVNYPHAISGTPTSGDATGSIRYTMASTAHAFAHFMLSKHPDQPSLMEQICRTISYILSLTWTLPGKRTASAFMNDQLKRKYHTPITNNTFSRYIYLVDCQNTHLTRVEFAARQLPYLKTHQTLQDDLFALIQSPYDKVRTSAVKALQSTFWRFPMSRVSYIHKVAEVMSSDRDESTSSATEFRSSMLGLLTLTTNKSFMRRICRDWKTISAFTKALLTRISSNDDDKLSQGLNIAFFQLFRGIRQVHVPPLQVWNNQLDSINTSQYPAFPTLGIDGAQNDVADATLSSNTDDATNELIGLVDFLLQQLEGDQNSGQGSEASWSHHLMIVILLSAIADHPILFDDDKCKQQRMAIQSLFLQSLQSELPPVRTGSIAALTLMMSRQLGNTVIDRHVHQQSFIHCGWAQHAASIQRGESPSSSSSSTAGKDTSASDTSPAYPLSENDPIMTLFADEQQIAGFLSYLSQDQPVQRSNHGSSMRARMMDSFFQGNMTGLSDLTNGVLKSVLSTFCSYRYDSHWGPENAGSQDFVTGYAVFFEIAFMCVAHNPSVDRKAMEEIISRLFGQCEALLQDSREQQSGDESSNDHSKEMTVSYVLGGLLRSIDSWPFAAEQCSQMIDELITPVVRQCLEAASPETYRSWVNMLSFATKNKSMEQAGWLYDVVASILFDGKTSFSQTKRLEYLSAVVSELSWRVDQDRFDPLVRQLIERIPNSFKQVRLEMALCLSLVFAVRWTCPTDFIDGKALDVQTLLHQGQSSNDMMLEKNLLEMLDALDALRRQEEQEQIKGSDSGYGSEMEGVTSEYQKMAEVVVNFVTTLTSQGASYVIEPYLAELLSPIFLLQDEKSDQKMTERALGCISLISQCRISRQVMEKMLDQIGLLVNSPSWRVRGSLLMLIGNMHIMGQFVLDDIIKERLFGFVSQLLQDKQLEVREAACGSLSHMLVGIEPSLRDELIAQFQEMARTKVKKNKKNKNKKNKDDDDPMDLEDKEAQDKKERKNSKKLRTRHAGVLGLSALILANPYEVPEDWMPDVLMELTGHVSDPSPINESVKSLFLEFKRTHQDSWHLEKMKFSHDQLGVLTDLMVSPSYYV
eukprot:TRINITY_DN539_c0_g1_i5.p1 TRINITY_DN539_c0_g1~~TRINITY_DN539_c0_g1_i5.p1  ORF type:complete len:1612 (-),score=545.12 TRINITY_DN539_c0_g1_i5:1236-6071(-)